MVQLEFGVKDTFSPMDDRQSLENHPQSTSSIIKNLKPLKCTMIEKSSLLPALVSLAFTATIATIISIRQHQEIERKCSELEKEVSSLLLKLENQNKDTANSTNESDDNTDDGIYVKRVGTIRSIYRLCVGTPRQGLLAPNARGCIELEKLGDSSTASSVSGLEGYSHIWILFVFHLNTKSKSAKRIKSKIAPPALGGDKVGIFATRTPHRFNPIGITLCKLDRIQTIRAGKKEKVILHISGLDLVDGTPVLDIKPYVPVYDSVAANVKLPPWVEGGLATQRKVSYSESSIKELTSILEQNKNALQFYGPKYGEKSTEETLESIQRCITQVLAIDVRSSFQTKKAREGKFQAERSVRLKDMRNEVNEVSEVCTQQIDNLLIKYTVDEETNTKRSSSEGSGAEDIVTVLSIQLLTGQGD